MDDREQYVNVKEAQKSLGMCEEDANEYARIVVFEDGDLADKFRMLQPLIDKWLMENTI